jgi:transcriptional regulator GlxA family with amidase domain
MKVAFIAWENCTIQDVAPVLTALKRAEYAVRTLTIDGLPVTADCGLTLLPYGALGKASPRDFQWLLLPSGGMTTALLENPHLHRFIRQFNGQHNAWLAASGDACVILGATGQLGGLRFTGPSDTVQKYASLFTYSAYTGEDVCLDGNVFTAKNNVGRALAEAICKRIGVEAG